MSVYVDGERLDAARMATLRRFHAARTGQGLWTGELTGSPLATAVAVSALAVAEQHVDDQPTAGAPGHDAWLSGVLIRSELSQLLIASLRWMADRQNGDGGWGDAAGGPSNLPATLSVRAALQLTGVPAKYAGLVERAEAYIASHGGPLALRSATHEFSDQATAVLAHYAIADLISWRQIPVLRPELFCLPRAWRERRLGSERSFAPVACAALGAARAHHAPTRNPLLSFLRRGAQRAALAALADMQPPSGGFLASTTATGYVVMALATIGQGDKGVARRGVEFLLSTVRPDGSWAIEPDHAVWNTARAVAVIDQADASCGEEPAACAAATERAVDWLLTRYQADQAPGDRAARGGWAASGWDGGPLSTIVTGAALIALAVSHRRRPRRHEEILRTATAAVEWLLASEHEDGGWPEFPGLAAVAARCGADATSAAVRALEAAQRDLRLSGHDAALARRVRAAVSRGVAHLAALQSADGSWESLAHGTCCHALRSNRVLGTSLVLATLRELGMKDEDMAQRGVQWLMTARGTAGGWLPEAASDASAGARSATSKASRQTRICVEEVAAATAALLPYGHADQRIERAVDASLAWLAEGSLGERLDDPAPICLSFDDLWYADRFDATLLTARAFVGAHADAHASATHPAASLPA